MDVLVGVCVTVPVFVGVLIAVFVAVPVAVDVSIGVCVTVDARAKRPAAAAAGSVCRTARLLLTMRGGRSSSAKRTYQLTNASRRGAGAYRATGRRNALSVPSQNSAA